MSKEERKLITRYKGEPVEYLGEAMIFGKKYIDIRLPNGIRKTVPASACQTERKENEPEF